MIKKIIFTVFLLFLVTNYSFSAGTTDTSSKSDYDKAANLIKSAKKYEAKNKTKKAIKRYKKALKLLLKENKKKPNQANTLNYLGFASRKLGDYENGEKYYLLGLEIDPNHTGINEYLGELYVATNRIELAKERLAVLKNCNCEEYKELKDIIEGNKESKY
tara:strand:+ start:764 stop:1246 length:483 start_codon:yes stop_codon:yes gene_type:complete